MGRWWGWIVAGVCLVAALYLTDQADARASRAEGQVVVLDRLRAAAEARARRDSAALDTARAGALRREIELEAARARSQREASAAAQRAAGAARALRATLDSLGAGTEALDELERSHGAERLAMQAEIAQADSMTANVRSLLRATEVALESERAARQADVPLIAALREQVGALQSQRRRGQVELWATRAAVVVIAAAALR